MAVEFKVINANATQTNMIIGVAYKRTDDTEPVRTENITYPEGTTFADIKSDLELRAKSAIAIYENDIVTEEALDELSDWQEVVEEE